MKAKPPSSTRNNQLSFRQTVQSRDPIFFSYSEMERDPPQAFMHHNGTNFFSSLNTSSIAKKFLTATSHAIEICPLETFNELGTIQNPPRNNLYGRFGKIGNIFDTNTSGFLINNEILGNLVAKLLDRALKEGRSITQRVEFNSPTGIIYIQISGPYALVEKRVDQPSMSDLKGLSLRDQVFPDFGSVSAILKPTAGESRQGQSQLTRRKKEDAMKDAKFSEMSRVREERRAFPINSNYEERRKKIGVGNVLDQGFGGLGGQNLDYLGRNMHFGGDAQFFEELDMGLDSAFPLTNQFSQPTVSSFNGQCPYFVNEKQYDAIIRRRKKKQKKMLLYGMNFNSLFIKNNFFLKFN